MMTLWILAGASLLAASWLRAAGSALSELPRADAHHDAAEGRAGARAVADLLEDRARIAPSVGVVASALLITAAVTAAAIVMNLESGAPLVAAVIGVTILILVVGDVAPRFLGRRTPRSVAYRSAWLLTAAVRVGAWAAEDTPDDRNGGTDEETDIDDEERVLISSVLRFSETVVREVMVPRPDMITVAGDADAEKLIAAAVEHGFSRFPVIDSDEVVGVVLVKDLMGPLNDDVQAVMARAVMRQAMFVPEVCRIADVLADMRGARSHMAIVVDEFGEISGLVTIEDLLEELVGEISDETDDEEPLVEEIDERTWRVDARMSVEDLAALIDLDFPEGEWDTLGGLVLGLAERVPEEAESFPVDSGLLTVTRMQGRRVAEVVVTSDNPTPNGHSR